MCRGTYAMTKEKNISHKNWKSIGGHSVCHQKSSLTKIMLIRVVKFSIVTFYRIFSPRSYMLQLKEYETDPQFLQFIQNLIIDSLLIYMFWTSCEHEIVFVLICRTVKQKRIGCQIQAQVKNYGSISYYILTESCPFFCPGVIPFQKMSIEFAHFKA